MQPYKLIPKRYFVAAFVAAFSTAAYPGESTICKHYAAKLPNIKQTQCEAADLQDRAARSVKGRTIWTSDIKHRVAGTRVLVIGGMHGDELSSSAVAFHWIQMAQKLPADMRQSVHWRFIPALNPDGLFAQPAKRVNAHGVDLNRNFPTPNWVRDSRTYWEKRTGKDPRRWPGPSPLSEPETRFLYEQMDSFKPSLIVTIHAPYGVLDFDGPAVPPNKLGRLHLNQLGIFPGSLGNYGGVHMGIPVVTIELPSAARTPSEAEIEKIWLDLLGWMEKRFRSPLPPSKTLAAASPPLREEVSRQ